MIEHIGSAPRTHWVETLIKIMILLAALCLLWQVLAEITALRDKVYVLEQRPVATPHPSTEPIADRADESWSHAEYAHKRIDKLIDGIKAFVPRIEGRDRVPALIDEAAR